jgi:hypothetical protein
VRRCNLYVNYTHPVVRVGVSARSPGAQALDSSSGRAEAPRQPRVNSRVPGTDPGLIQIKSAVLGEPRRGRPFSIRGSRDCAERDRQHIVVH